MIAAGAALLLPDAAWAVAAPPSLRVLLLLPEAADPGTIITEDTSDAWRDGATLGAGEAARAAALLGGSATLLEARGAPDIAALRRRVRDEAVGAIVGALDAPGVAPLALALPDVPFLNVGDADGTPAEARCAAHVFHVAPSGTMRLDAALLWLGARDDAARWRLALPAGEAGERLRARVRRRAPSLAATLIAGPGAADAPRLALDDSAPQDSASRETASRDPVAARVVAWHASLERYGAAQLNDRFRARFARPMPAAAWSAWAAVKIAWEAASGPRGALAPAGRLAGAAARYDGHKGRPLDFRPWDHQLRQPLYVVEEGAPDAAEPRVATMPPDEGGASSRAALDRLGDSREESACGARSPA